MASAARRSGSSDPAVDGQSCRHRRGCGDGDPSHATTPIAHRCRAPHRRNRPQWSRDHGALRSTMSPRDPGRTQPCSKADAETRMRHAHKFLEVAGLVAGEGDDIEYASPAAALAVLAGIAASDAACCKALGRRSRAQDHREAAGLVEQVTPGGRQAANQLRRLLNLKDEAHYGLFDVGGQDLKTALRQAANLVEFAGDVLRR
jgi:hypothetical protein